MHQSFLHPRPPHGGNLAWAASLAGCSPDQILDFSASINPLGPPASAIAAIQKSWPSLKHYPDPNYTQLRQILAQQHGLSPEWILPGNGSAELLTWASRDLAQLPTTYLLTPAFGDYLRGLRAFEANVIRYAIDLPLSDLPAQKQDGLLVNTPHNPTGLLLPIADLLALLDRLALVVVDEAFIDFLWPDQQQSLADQVVNFPNLVVLRSLTKFYSLPGLRLGYAIAHPDRIQRWQQWRDPWSVNTLAEAAAIAVLQDTAFQQQTWAWLEAARAQLFAGLKALSGLEPLPGAANFLLVRCDRSVQELQHTLLCRHRILIRDCLSFPELSDRYFRVAVRTLAENQQLLRAIAEIVSSPSIS